MGNSGPRTREAGARPPQALDDRVPRALGAEGRIERFDTAILKPQSTELGGFILIQGTQQQIDALRGDHEFGRWVTQIQLVADKVGIVDAWVNQGLPDAIDLYEEALERLD